MSQIEQLPARLQDVMYQAEMPCRELANGLAEGNKLKAGYERMTRAFGFTAGVSDIILNPSSYPDASLEQFSEFINSPSNERPVRPGTYANNEIMRRTATAFALLSFTGEPISNVSVCREGKINMASESKARIMLSNQGYVEECYLPEARRKFYAPTDKLALRFCQDVYWQDALARMARR